MKKWRKLHYWIGIVSMTFLLIQAITGLVLYFNKSGNGAGGMEQPPMMQQGTTNNGTTTDGSTVPNTSENGQNNNSMTPPNGEMNAPDQQNGNGQAPNSNNSVSKSATNISTNESTQTQTNIAPTNQMNNSSSLTRTIKSLHEGVIGLISAIGLLLMSGTGLVLAVMMNQAKRKAKARKREMAEL